MVQHRGGKPIGIVLREARLAKDRDGLRRGEIDHCRARRDIHIGRRGHRRALGGQIAQQRIEQLAQFFGGDVAYRADIDAITGQHGLMRPNQVLAGQPGHRLKRAVERTAVGVVAERDLVEGLAGDVVRVFLVRLDVRDHLTAHPLYGVFVKTRLQQCGAQKLDGGVAVFGQETGRDGKRVIRHVKAEVGCQRFGLAAKGARVHVACALFQEAGHQVDRAAFAGGVQ